MHECIFLYLFCSHRVCARVCGRVSMWLNVCVCMYVCVLMSRHRHHDCVAGQHRSPLQFMRMLTSVVFLIKLLIAGDLNFLKWLQAVVLAQCALQGLLNISCSFPFVYSVRFVLHIVGIIFMKLNEWPFLCRWHFAQWNVTGKFALCFVLFCLWWKCYKISNEWTAEKDISVSN